ncbi:hypothetical protein KEM56_003855 [Ascosphaera pollenicola]|nr:hypothetical protein KEM56_003855 [Ascosphaera pollenicola]
MPKKSSYWHGKAPSSCMQSLAASSALVVDLSPNLKLALKALLAGLGSSPPTPETVQKVRSVFADHKFEGDDVAKAQKIIELRIEGVTQQYNACFLAMSLVFPYMPREEQVDAVRWLNYEKKDLILVAKTAFGKSTVLQFVFMLQCDSVTIIILPLDQIGKEQKEKVEKLSGKPFFLHGPTNNAKNRQRIANSEFTHVLIGPEQAVTDQMRLVFQSSTLN